MSMCCTGVGFDDESVQSTDASSTTSCFDLFPWMNLPHSSCRFLSCEPPCLESGLTAGSSWGLSTVKLLEHVSSCWGLRSSSSSFFFSQFRLCGSTSFSPRLVKLWLDADGGVQRSEGRLLLKWPETSDVSLLSLMLPHADCPHVESKKREAACYTWLSYINSANCEFSWTHLC